MADTPAAGDTSGAARIRLDKWLWHARLCKTRSLAARLVQGGQVRVNAERITKPARAIGPGDTLTLVLGERVRVLRVEAPGTRRGPAPEAQTLYTDLSPPAPEIPAPRAGPRPTGRDRRLYDRWRDRGSGGPLE